MFGNSVLQSAPRFHGVMTHIFNSFKFLNFDQVDRSLIELTGNGPNFLLSRRASFEEDHIKYVIELVNTSL